MIIVPTSVMLNWEFELKKWCPAFKILTYFGSLKERKQKRVVGVGRIVLHPDNPMRKTVWLHKRKSLGLTKVLKSCRITNGLSFKHRRLEEVWVFVEE